MPFRSTIHLATLRLLLLIAASALLAAPALAEDLASDMQAAIARAKLGETQVGIHVIDLDTGQTLFSRNADRPLMPASNLKLVTTAGALALLGPDFSFRTELRLLPSGPAPRPQDPSLVIIGDGDPALGDPDILARYQLDIEMLLQAWVAAVTDAGIQQLDAVIADDRIFDRQGVHASWPPNDLLKWYCAPVTGLIINDNCLDMWPAPRGPGQPIAMRLRPEAPFLDVRNEAVTGRNDAFWAWHAPGSNAMIYKGEVANPFVAPVSIPLGDPVQFTAELLAHRLRAAGVQVGQARAAQPTDTFKGKALHYIQTRLPLVLRRCNTDSQNLFAEALLKRIGYATTGRPGSWDSGEAAILEFLSRQGLDTTGMVLADGSGLARDNRVTPAQLTGVLALMHSEPAWRDIYLDSLAQAGRDGTLRRRMDSGLQSQVLAKTGYIRGVSGLSGYLRIGTIADGIAERTIAFSFLFNGPTSNHTLKALQDRLVGILDAACAEPAPLMGG